jgi:hypothetical protein
MTWASLSGRRLPGIASCDVGQLCPCEKHQPRRMLNLLDRFEEASPPPPPLLACSFSPGCLYGATTYIEAFTFAVVTHMTIGGWRWCWYVLAAVVGGAGAGVCGLCNVGGDGRCWFGAVCGMLFAAWAGGWQDRIWGLEAPSAFLCARAVSGRLLCGLAAAAGAAARVAPPPVLSCLLSRMLLLTGGCVV